MKLRRFLDLVPKPVKLWAIVLMACTVLIGLTAACKTAPSADLPRIALIYGAASLAFGCFLAIWLLSLGYVYADARRRAMRPILWVLVAALFPHLLGFLLYFVLRQPIAATCPHCGMAVSNHQRFCSWCGAALTTPVSTSQPPLTQL
jgi:hypothetical protein